MTDHFERIEGHFASWLQSHGDGGPVGVVAATLAAGDFSSAIQIAIDQFGVGDEPWFRGQVLDLILDYARSRLTEEAWSIDQVADIRLLCRACQVRSEEFMDLRPAEVSQLLQERVDAVLDDVRITGDEELHFVALQAAFDLSYDDFLALARPALERGALLLPHQLEDGSIDLHSYTRDLTPLYALSCKQMRSLGALY